MDASSGHDAGRRKREALALESRGMRVRSRLFVSALIATLFGAGTAIAAEILSPDTLFDFLRHDRFSVTWDPESAVTGDFDGDGRLDAAALGTEGTSVVVAVATRPEGSYMHVQYLAFAVDARSQGAICSSKVKLETE